MWQRTFIKKITKLVPTLTQDQRMELSVYLFRLRTSYLLELRIRDPDNINFPQINQILKAISKTRAYIDSPNFFNRYELERSATIVNMHFGSALSRATSLLLSGNKKGAKRMLDLARNSRWCKDWYKVVVSDWLETSFRQFICAITIAKDREQVISYIEQLKGEKP
jgi:hypothetical protein